MEAQVKHLSISLSEAVKYAKLVDPADIIYKSAMNPATKKSFNIYTQVAYGYQVDSSNNKNVSTTFGCAH